MKTERTPNGPGFPPPSLDPLHDIHLENGCFADTRPEQLNELFEAFERSGRDVMAVHFHGGLVDKEAGMATARRLQCWFEDAGAFPVFFIWESGLKEIFLNNLGEIGQEGVFQRLLTHVTRFVMGKVAGTLSAETGLRSPGGRLELPDESDVAVELARAEAGKVPYAEAVLTGEEDSVGLAPEQKDQFVQALEADLELNEAVEAIVQGLLGEDREEAPEGATRSTRVCASATSLMSPDILEELRKDTIKPARGLITTAKIVQRALTVLEAVLSRLARGRDHGIYLTVVEEILRVFYLANAGKYLWDLIKKDAHDAFGGDPEIHGGTAFVERLAAQHAAGMGPARVVLTGHSTGAIYICHLLDYVQEAELPDDLQFEVIFLAPAATFDRVAETLERSGNRVTGFRTFGMRDELEQNDSTAPLVYPSSLLYFVSGVCEDRPDEPLIGMERFYSGMGPFAPGKSPNIALVKEFMAGMTDSQVWSREAGGPGKSSHAVHHGDFDNDDATLGSVGHILQYGF